MLHAIIICLMVYAIIICYKLYAIDHLQNPLPKQPIQSPTKTLYQSSLMNFFLVPNVLFIY